jgi:hypothetical protein
VICVFNLILLNGFDNFNMKSLSARLLNEVRNGSKQLAGRAHAHQVFDAVQTLISPIR